MPLSLAVETKDATKRHPQLSGKVPRLPVKKLAKSLQFSVADGKPERR
jgi:hypothetical protein